MLLISKLNAFLSKFVGPNAAHMIDAVFAIAIVDGVALSTSPAARLFLLHHARLGALIQLSVPPAVALSAKFRKAAGSQASLVDELVKGVQNILATAPAATTTTVVTAAPPPPPAS